MQRCLCCWRSKRNWRHAKREVLRCSTLSFLTSQLVQSGVSTQKGTRVEIIDVLAKMDERLARQDEILARQNETIRLMHRTLDHVAEGIERISQHTVHLGHLLVEQNLLVERTLTALRRLHS